MQISQNPKEECPALSWNAVCKQNYILKYRLLILRRTVVCMLKPYLRLFSALDGVFGTSEEIKGLLVPN